MALSIDGGKTFINRKISDSPFTPSSGVFFGDYTNLTVHNGVIRPIWTRLNSGSLSVWTDMTRLSDFIATTGIESPKAPDNLTFENYPNPTSDCEYVSFKLHTTATINLSVYDVNGKLVAEIIKNEIRGYGKYIEEIALHDLHIPDGTYFLKLQIDGKVKVNRLVKL